MSFNLLALLQEGAAESGAGALGDSPGAPQAQQGLSPMAMNILLFGSMIALFYFLLIRPQNKARKALEEKLSKLKSGDEVLLTSGFYATVDRVDGNLLYLKIGNTMVKARRNAVSAMANETDGR